MGSRPARRKACTRQRDLRFLRRGPKSLVDEFLKPLDHRDRAHVGNELIDLAIFIEVELIDPLKLLVFYPAFKAEKVPIVPCIRR